MQLQCVFEQDLGRSDTGGGGLGLIASDGDKHVKRPGRIPGS